MNSAETVFLGIVQGLTEFLPVSSSGHLVFFQNLLGFSKPELLLDTSLHLGTLTAICIHFRSDLRLMARELWKYLAGSLAGRKSLKNQEKGRQTSLAVWILAGSVPTALIGLGFKSHLERLFESVSVAAGMLIVTGFILASTRLLPFTYGRRKEVNILIALAVGTSQGLAIVPGISRSGATIACGLICGLERELAGRFSFLLSLPAIVGAFAMEWSEGMEGATGYLALFSGFVSSAVVGLLALRLLMGIVRRGHLSYFAPYCWAVGFLVLLLYR